VVAPTNRSPRRETLSCRPGLDFSRRLSWGFQRTPLHRTGLSSSTPALNPWGLRLWALRVGSPLPKDKSCSVFVVSHHLGGFLRRESCGFVAPRSRSWGSSRYGFEAQGAETPYETPPSATLNPSKSLHARSGPTCLHGSPGPLPSCRSPSENGSTPGFYSTGRVHDIPAALQPWAPYNFLGFLLHPTLYNLDSGRTTRTPKGESDTTLRSTGEPAHRNPGLLPARSVSRQPGSHPFLHRRCSRERFISRLPRDQVRPGSEVHTERVEGWRVLSARCFPSP
jgi:hypothetical protein